MIRNNATEGIFSLFENNCVSGYTIETVLEQNKKKKSPTLKEYLCRGAFIYLQRNWGYINDVETSKNSNNFLTVSQQQRQKCFGNEHRGSARTANRILEELEQGRPEIRKELLSGHQRGGNRRDVYIDEHDEQVDPVEGEEAEEVRVMKTRHV